MPFYEYQCDKCGVFDVMRGIKEDNLSVCPQCGGSKIVKLISLPAGIVFKGRSVNQYSDVLKGKYWRDKNGVRHKVGPGDGHTGSATVSKQTASPEEISQRKKVDAAKDKKQRSNESYNRYVKNVKRNKSRGNK